MSRRKRKLSTHEDIYSPAELVLSNDLIISKILQHFNLSQLYKFNRINKLWYHLVRNEIRIRSDYQFRIKYSVERVWKDAIVFPDLKTLDFKPSLLLILTTLSLTHDVMNEFQTLVNKYPFPCIVMSSQTIITCAEICRIQEKTRHKKHNWMQFIILGIPYMQCDFFTSLASHCTRSQAHELTKLKECVQSSSLFLLLKPKTMEFFSSNQSLSSQDLNRNSFAGAICHNFCIENKCGVESKFCNIRSSKLQFATVNLQSIGIENTVTKLKQLSSSKAAIKPLFGLVFAHSAFMYLQAFCWKDVFPDVPLFGLCGKQPVGNCNIFHESEKDSPTGLIYTSIVFVLAGYQQ